MEGTSNGEEPTSWEELYKVNLMPSEIFLKFRKEFQSLRVGLNLEALILFLYNAPLNDYHAKLVLKPLANNQKWKFIYEPLCHDVQLVSRKIPLTKFLFLQVGIGHSFHLNATGWKWKLGTRLGGDGASRVQNKTSVALCPGVGCRFGWRADYVLPEITGGVGTDESLFNMKSGRLVLSLDRFEAVFTHTD
ncbi:hypothetical protein M569_15288, partial [Genlisea aurea]